MEKHLNMQNYKLIILPEYNIIVSDEETKEGDWKYNINSYQVWKTQYSSKDIDSSDSLRVVASENPDHNLPSINYSGLEEEFGIVDIEKLAETNSEKHHYAFCQQSEFYQLGFIEGFKKAQSLNDKKFTLEDMRNMHEITKKFTGEDNDGEGSYCTKSFNDIIQSLQKPKIFDIEIKMLECARDMPNIHLRYWEPKITNNQITITKKL